MFFVWWSGGLWVPLPRICPSQSHRQPRSTMELTLDWRCAGLLDGGMGKGVLRGSVCVFCGGRVGGGGGEGGGA